MSTAYTEIDVPALCDYLRTLGFQREYNGRTKEQVWVRRAKTDAGVGIVVHTSAVGSKARGCGTDALRLSLVDLKGPNGVTRGLKNSTRIHRVGGQEAIHGRIKERAVILAKWFQESIGGRDLSGRLTWKGSGKALDYSQSERKREELRERQEYVAVAA